LSVNAAARLRQRRLGRGVSPARIPPAALLIALVAVLGASFAAGVLYGSQDLPPGAVLRALWADEAGLAREVVMRIRLPRIGAALVCGALLALAGVLLQVLLRNPLADPYVLGISGGAGLGVLGGMLLGFAQPGSALAGLAGAFAVSVTVFGLGYRSGDWSPYRLLLTGVVLAAGCGALVSLLLVLAPQAQLKGMLFWLMGDLSYASSSAPAWGLALGLGAMATLYGGALNVLSLGRLKAATLGVPVARAETLVYFAAALATVAATLLGGTIGFVGLIVPHLLRLLGVVDLRWLIPLAMLTGAAFLGAADTLARSAWAPLQMPVGVLTALLGVPIMLLLLAQRR
jgi:iron complex transport system permease protein